MSELIVIGYPDSQKAEEARNTLYQLSKEYLVEIKDAVIAEANDKGEVKLNQMVSCGASARRVAPSGACSPASCSSTR